MSNPTDWPTYARENTQPAIDLARCWFLYEAQNRRCNASYDAAYLDRLKGFGVKPRIRKRDYVP